MHYPDSRWRPRCQGKSRDDVQWESCQLTIRIKIFARVIEIFQGVEPLIFFGRVLVFRFFGERVIAYCNFKGSTVFL